VHVPPEHVGTVELNSNVPSPIKGWPLFFHSKRTVEGHDVLVALSVVGPLTIPLEGEFIEMRHCAVET
jgi:hypothetical protein